MKHATGRSKRFELFKFIKERKTVSTELLPTLVMSGQRGCFVLKSLQKQK